MEFKVGPEVPALYEMRGTRTCLTTTSTDIILYVFVGSPVVAYFTPISLFVACKTKANRFKSFKVK
jgi:hypothetical protein